MVLPLTPPLALISSAAILTTQFNRPSILAMVPDEENRQPSLTVPLAAWAERMIAGIASGVASADRPSPVVARTNDRRENLVMKANSLLASAAGFHVIVSGEATPNSI